jgi:O-antigen/teichoic acid export membrane protein
MAESNEIRSIGKHTLVYATGIFLGKLAGFIMLPIYTRHLTPANYGTLSLLGTTMDIIGMIAGIGLASGVFKFYAQFDDQQDKDRVISTVAIGTIGLALITALAGFVFSPVLTRLVLAPDDPVFYFRLFFLTYFLQSTIGIPFMLIRAQNRSVLFVVLNLLKLIAQLTLNIIFVVNLQLGVTGVLLANVIVVAAMAVYMSHYVFRQTGILFSAPLFRQMSRFGAPLVLWSLGGFILAFSDRYFLRHVVDIAAVGIYSLGYKFAFLLTTIAVTPFALAWDPQRFFIARRPDGPEVFGRVFHYMNIALFGTAILMLLFVYDLLRVMVGPAFWGAYAVIPILLLSTVVQQWTHFCKFGMLYRNATHLSVWGAGIGVVAALGLNALLIPAYGMYGAAWATLGAYSLRFIPIHVFSQQLYRVDYPWARVSALTALYAAAWALRIPLNSASIPISLAGSSLAAAVFGAAVYRFLLGPDERAVVSRFARAAPRRVALAAWSSARSTRLFRYART